jgi:hypothetical protein
MVGASVPAGDTPPRPRVSALALMLGSGPRFARDAFGPVVLFYVGWKFIGFQTAILAATALAIAAYVFERRQARSGITAGLGLGIALVQATAGLASGSTTAYFAPPIIIIDMCRSNRHYGHKKAGSSEAAIKDRRSAGRLRAFLVIRHNAAMSSSTLSGRPLASVALK